MFQLQTKENEKIQQETAEVSAELKKVHKQLQIEKTKNKQKEQQLQKTETLYLRTMAARKAIHDSYLEQQAQIQGAEKQIRQYGVGRQELLKVLEGRDSEILQLTE